MYTAQPSLSATAEVDTASLVLSAAQDKCEIGGSNWLCCTPAGSGSSCSAPELMVRMMSLYCAATLACAGSGTQVWVIGGSEVNASLVPSGLIAGSSPGAMAVRSPPLILTDSTSAWQPAASVK